MRNQAKSVAEYLESLPEDRRKVVSKVRGLLRRRMPKGYREGVMWGVITYFIPLGRFPKTYNGEPLCYVALAAQKNYFALYLMSVYTDASKLAALQAGFKKAGKKLDMGKSCVRFRSLDDLPLDVIGDAVAAMPPAAYIAGYEKAQGKRAPSRKGP